jgi:hypothetical protein
MHLEIIAENNQRHQEHVQAGTICIHRMTALMHRFESKQLSPDEENCLNSSQGCNCCPLHQYLTAHHLQPEHNPDFIYNYSF